MLAQLIEKATLKAGGVRKLGQLLGTSPSHISEWKADKRRCPDEMVAKMAAIADLDVEQTFKAVAWERLRRIAAWVVRKPVSRRRAAI